MRPPQRRLVTQSEYARIKGVNPSSVNRQVLAGRIVLVGRLVDVAQADGAWGESDPSAPRGLASRNGHETKPPPNGNGPAAGTYSAHRGRREETLAKLADLEYRRKVGELVDAAEVQRAAFDAARRARNAVLAVPPRLAAILASIVDPGEIELRLRTELEAACEAIADEEIAKTV